MNLSEAYTLLFTDVLMSNLAFNFSVEVIFDSMKIFNQYNIGLMIIVSMLAYSISIIINYFFGIICYKILAPLNKTNSANQNIISYLFRLKKSLNILLIMLSCIPILGKFIILFLGFSKVEFRQVLFISILAKLIYYFIDIIFL